MKNSFWFLTILGKQLLLVSPLFWGVLKGGYVRRRLYTYFGFGGGLSSFAPAAITKCTNWDVMNSRSFLPSSWRQKFMVAMLAGAVSPEHLLLGSQMPSFQCSFTWLQKGPRRLSEAL
jgi:hypothetical protein